MTLDEIAIKHGTDKATTHPVYGHGYSPYYEIVFEPLRDKPIKFLEIGVGGGESIRTWLEYFSQARVYGVDKVKGTNPWNTPGEKPHERYTFVAGDQTDEVMWKCFRADHGDDWDVIIDDGGHVNDQVIISFNGLWPFVKSGGVYCIEDLGVSYGVGSVHIVSGWPKHMEFIKKLWDDMNTMPPSRELPEWIFSFRELAILKKR